MFNKTLIRAMRQPERGFDLCLYHLEEAPDGKLFHVEHTYKQVPLDEGVAGYPNPMAQLDENEAQLLMDELWRAGLRPSNRPGAAGQLEATQNHLADMRKIVEKYAGVPL